MFEAKARDSTRKHAMQKAAHIVEDKMEDIEKLAENTSSDMLKPSNRNEDATKHSSPAHKRPRVVPGMKREAETLTV